MAPVESLCVSAPRRRLGAYEESAADRDLVCLRGEYDLSTAPALAALLAAAIARDGTDVVIDLSGVDFIGRGHRRRDHPRPRVLAGAIAIADVAIAVSVRATHPRPVWRRGGRRRPPTAFERARRTWVQVPAAGP